MSKRILVVEDQADNRQIIRDMLAPTDYEIIEAEDGEQALAAIGKQRPDLILMDIQLPIMDGYTPQAGLKPILRCARSRSSRSRPARSVGKKRRRGRRAVMTMCRNLLARANCWRKFGITCNSGWHVTGIRLRPARP
jgi:ActR/RegA family two-component response regulator